LLYSVAVLRSAQGQVTDILKVVKSFFPDPLCSSWSHSMRKRTLFLAAAAGLLASLALSTASQAGPVFPLAYTYSSAADGPQTIHATSIGTGSASITFTPTPGSANPGSAPEAPAAGDAYIPIATYTQTATGNGITLSGFPPVATVNGGFYTGQTVEQTVTVKYGTGTGTFTVTETMNGLAYSGNLITPGITTSGPVVIDGITFKVYEQGTSFNNVTGMSRVIIGIEATAVPEPTSMALLGIGMASFIAFRKYFKRPAVA
jgi:hypothetical protein